MTPSLAGRLQTRLFLILVIGGLWSAVLTPLLDAPGPLPERYVATFSVLLTVVVIGLAWEFVYHGLQQFRWEKDWPILLSLLTGVSEGLVVWAVIRTGLVPAAAVPPDLFLIHFTSTWLITWLFLVGPMRVLFIRWRFTGGRLI